MSRRRVYSQDTLSIMKRFFNAVEDCRKNKLITSYTDFCRDNNIDKAHFYTQRKDLNRGFFEVGWLCPLIDLCGVSAYWLMTGKGNMFNK